jgi:hypothetical protein
MSSTYFSEYTRNKLEDLRAQVLELGEALNPEQGMAESATRMDVDFVIRRMLNETEAECKGHAHMSRAFASTFLKGAQLVRVHLGEIWVGVVCTAGCVAMCAHGSPETGALSRAPSHSPRADSKKHTVQRVFRAVWGKECHPRCDGGTSTREPQVTHCRSGGGSCRRSCPATQRRIPTDVQEET